MSQLADIVAWESLIAELEDQLDRHEEQVRSGEIVAVAAWETPAELGPLPVQFADRASHLARRTDLLATFVKYQLSALEADLEHVHRQEQQKGTPNRAVALFLDASV